MRGLNVEVETIVIDIAELNNGQLLYEVNHNLKDHEKLVAVLYDLVKRMECQPSGFKSKNFNL